MSAAEVFRILVTPVPLSAGLFVAMLVIGYLVDFRLRAVSNSRTLRVVLWLSEAHHAEAMRDCRVRASRSGWGPLTGLPPLRYRVWTWSSACLRPRTSFGIASHGIAFDCFPGERTFRFLSKTVGPTVAVRSDGEWLSLEGRNPDFSPRVATVVRGAGQMRHYPDNAATSCFFLAALCYVVVLSPLLACATFVAFAVGYYLSLKIGGVA